MIFTGCAGMLARQRKSTKHGLWGLLRALRAPRHTKRSHLPSAFISNDKCTSLSSNFVVTKPETFCLGFCMGLGTGERTVAVSYWQAT